MRQRSPEAKARRAEQARRRYWTDPEAERQRKRDEFTEHGRASEPTPEQRARWNATWAERYPERAAAHQAVKRAIRDGSLRPAKACERCSATGRIEAHHEDYSRPLDVEWLCRRCHGVTRRVEQETRTQEKAA